MSRRKLHYGFKTLILAAFFLYSIAFISLGNTDNFSAAPEDILLHRNDSLQANGEEPGSLLAERENIVNTEKEAAALEDKEEEEREWKETERQEKKKEPEATSREDSPNEVATSEKTEEDEVKEESRVKVPSRSENVQASGQGINNDQALNSYVLDVIKTYSIGEGNYPYLLNNDYANYNGVTRTLAYQGKTLLKAHPSGNKASHCVGITFEVFFRAMQERNRQLGIPVDDFNGMNWDELFDFVLNWYVASGSKKTNNIVLAVEKYGIGRAINRLEDVQPGDFIDFNRENGTGHTVIFINWIKNAGGNIIGLRYWSSQGSTGGISYNEEYFNVVDQNGTRYGSVKKDELYIVRILPVSQYQ